MARNLMQSTFEWRRIAPLHFWAKADNARLSAATLWHLCEDDVAVRAIIGEVGYRGTPYCLRGGILARSGNHS